MNSVEELEAVIPVVKKRLLAVSGVKGVETEIQLQIAVRCSLSDVQNEDNRAAIYEVERKIQALFPNVIFDFNLVWQKTWITKLNLKSN